MPTSESQLKANKKWRENNREKFNQSCLKSTKKYNLEHKEEIKIKQHGFYILRKEKSKVLKLETEII
jgi:hypothetical protein